MKKILHLISSLQGAQSYSIKLGNAIVERIEQKYSGSTVKVLNLVENEVPHLNPATLKSFFTPKDQLTEEEQDLIRYSDEAVEKLLEADIIVVGAPFYNNTIPSSLKAWIDQIVRAGITFGYSETGPVGLVKDKKVYVAMASGGIYSDGPGKANDFAAPYLQSVFGLLGMTDVTVFRAEGLKVPGVKEFAFEKAIESIRID